jgi:hypothetical protein
MDDYKLKQIKTEKKILWIFVPLYAAAFAIMLLYAWKHS